MNELDDLLHLQRRIQKLRKEEERHEFWICKLDREVYAAHIKGKKVYLSAPLRYDDIENTDHLSEFQYTGPITEADKNDFERSVTLNISRAHMCKPGWKGKPSRKRISKATSAGRGMRAVR